MAVVARADAARGTAAIRRPRGGAARDVGDRLPLRGSLLPDAEGFASEPAPIRRRFAPEPLTSGAEVGGLFAAPDSRSPWGPRLAIAGVIVALLAIVGSVAAFRGSSHPASGRRRGTPGAARARSSAARAACSPSAAGCRTRAARTAIAESHRDGLPVRRRWLVPDQRPRALDVPTLTAGAESAFAVTIPVNGAVARYRVSFRDSAGHRDRARGPTRSAPRWRATSEGADMPMQARACRSPPRSPGGGRRHARRATAAAARKTTPQSFRFRSAVELINVTATVTDASGRFVRACARRTSASSRTASEQPITHFSSERVPVSLGIALDTSGSMDGEKMVAAREALDALPRRPARSRGRSVPLSLLDRPGAGRRLDDEPRAAAVAAAAGCRRDGGTAMYDAVAEAMPLAQTGRHRKKALLIISDGNDTNSRRPSPTSSARSARARCWSTRSASTAESTT